MAAYAALVSLMNTMDHIQNHPCLLISLDKKQIESLNDKVGFLLDFIESSSHGGNKEAEVLESQIASAADEVEDLILAGSTGKEIKSSISLRGIRIVAEDIKRKVMIKPINSMRLLHSFKKMDSIKKKVMKVKEERGSQDVQPTYSMPATSSTPLTSTRKSTIVGFDRDLIQLMEALTGKRSNRQIIPIVGMGGIGKTTLARNVYENSLIMQYFDIRAWAKISQKYSVREILFKLLSCLSKSTSEMDGKDEDQLGEQFYKSLSGRRYLIILDDIWSMEAWDKINRFLPNKNNGSRIVVTTRQADMAIDFGSSCHVMSFLDEDNSWKLFCQTTFAQEGCPPELEGIGKKIVEKCKGLPLSIVMIGGLLGKCSQTQEYWENVAKDNSIVNSGEEGQSLDILSLSYSHLPVHLKPCFLYMGIFPEDHEIHVSELIKRWVAEGFIKPNQTRSLEEVAEGYLKDLIDRNLVLVGRLGWNGKIRTCSIHDLLRDLCLKTAQKENFFHVISVCDVPRGICNHIRLFLDLKSATHTRSLVRKRRLLRVLNVLDDDYKLDVKYISKQVNLHYVCISSARKLPRLHLHDFVSSISLLWNVQTLIIRCNGEFVAPSEIWSMPQLRHLDFPRTLFPQPPSSDQQNDFVLRNLQTLKRVHLRLTEEVCKRIPNVKKLAMYSWDRVSLESTLEDVGRLHKLESLKLYSVNIKPNLIKFPSSLRKLTLARCSLHWEGLTIIGSLPHLEVLKLENDAVRGSEWNPVEGEFLRLKFLGIYYCYDLISWNADNSHFPILEHLVLNGLTKLEEIPSGIGDIQTLRVIELDVCSDSAGISAMSILEEQESLGNEGLQVRLVLWDKARVERFTEQVEHFESFKSVNFQLSAVNRFS